MSVETLTRLLHEMDSLAPTANTMNRYFDGEAQPQQLGLALPPDMRHFQVIINWPRQVVQAIEERLQVLGFRVTEGADDERLWDWWQRNNLDEEASLGHTEALAVGRAYITVGRGDDPDTPLITVESGRHMVVDMDIRTRKPRAAVRLYNADGEDPKSPQRATLYLAGRNEFYRRDAQGAWTADPEYPSYDTGVSDVLVVPLINRGRLGDRHGRSEIKDITGLTDAACRTLTNLQGAQELLAVPQRYAIGVRKEDFQAPAPTAEDPSAVRDVSKWESYLGNLLMLTNDQAKVGQFSAAQLETFTNTVMFYARQVSALTGLPLRYLGIAGDVNGSSGDAIREDVEKLVKRCERISRSFSGAWEEAMRLAARLVDGDSADTMPRLEVVWQDPNTPTAAAMADAAVKLYSATNEREGALLPREEVWIQMGFGPEKRRQLTELFQDDAINNLIRMAGNGSADIQRGSDSTDNAADTPGNTSAGPASGPAKQPANSPANS